MKFVIAGPRIFSTFMDIQIAFQTLDRYESTITEVISGWARGSDKIGAIWAIVRGKKLTSMPADWDKHRKAAGPIRNGQMADLTDAAIIFWDEESAGTKNMIGQMAKRKKPHLVRIVKPMERFSEELPIDHKLFEEIIQKLGIQNLEALADLVSNRKPLLIP